jgi:hypothetical protein
MPEAAAEQPVGQRWLAPCLVFAWGLGYLLGLVSVRSKRRSAGAFQNADLYALITNAMFLIALAGIFFGGTAPEFTPISVVFVVGSAFAGGNSFAYWRQRLKELGPIG